MAQLIRLKVTTKKKAEVGTLHVSNAQSAFEAVFASARFCPCCNYEFQFDESIKIEAIASNAAVLSIH